AGAMLLAVYFSGCTTAQKREDGGSRTSSTKEAGIDDRAKWAVQNDTQAISKALQVFGDTGKDSTRTTAQLVTLENDETPFLHNEVTNRPIWKITIVQRGLGLPSTLPTDVDQNEWTFDILLDAVKGKLIRITSKWPTGLPDSAPEPRAASAEEQMKNSGRE